MLQLAVDVYFPDGCVQEFSLVGLLCGLVKTNIVQVRSGQLSKGVLNVVLYLVVILVHCLIVMLIVMFLLNRAEILFQFRDSCSLLSRDLAEDFHLLEEVLVGAAASAVSYWVCSWGSGGCYLPRRLVCLLISLESHPWGILCPFLHLVEPESPV